MSFDWAKILQSIRDTPLFVLVALAAASWIVLLPPARLGVDPGPAINEWRSDAFVSAAVFTMLSLARALERLGSAVRQARTAARAARRLSFNAAPQFALVNKSKQTDGTFTTQLLIDIEVLNHSSAAVGLAGATLARPCAPRARVLHMDVCVLSVSSGTPGHRYLLGPNSLTLVRLHCILRGVYALPGSRAQFVVHDTAGNHHRFPPMRLKGNPNEATASRFARALLWLRVGLGMSV
jgi:hypothetical protein